MEYKFLVNLDDHEGSGIKTKKRIAANGEVEEEMSSVQDGVGPHMMYNVTDTVMNKIVSGTTYDEVSKMSHEHRYGFETFFVDSGSMYVYIDGVRVIVKEGDILHLQPGQQHAMASIEDVKFRGFFHDLDSFTDGMKNQELTEMMPELANDPDWGPTVMGGKDGIKRVRPYYEDVPAEKVHAVKHADRPVKAYKFDGVTAKIMVPRWENHGVCEYVLFEMEPGFTANWVKFPSEREMYYVRSGKVKFTILGKEYIATKSCLVNIPKFAPHSVVALEKSEVYDMGGQTMWFSFLQDYVSLKHNEPEQFADPAVIADLKKKFKCDIESIGMTEV